MKSIQENSASLAGKTLPPAPAKSPKLTPWFDARVKPVRVGTYEVRQLGLRSKAEWNGRAWLTNRWPMYATLGDKWRGLASNPAKGEVMSRKSYPQIGSSKRMDAWDKLPDRAAPKCAACGARALFAVWVETNYMRGDDVRRKTCREHKDNAAALMAGEPIKENE